MKPMIKKSSKIFALSSFIFLAACNTQQLSSTSSATLNDVKLIAQEQPLLSSSLLVSWSFVDDSAPVDIYQANEPTDAKKQLAASGVTGNSYLLKNNNEQRQYVFVQPKNGTGRWVGERVLPLEGGFNFRDLGGYPTADGREVKWGKLYRSGTMVDLTENDYAYLGELNLGVMCDLRSREELQHEPTQWQSFAPATNYMTNDYSMRELMSSEGALRFDQVKTAEDAQEMFKSFYRTGPYMLKDIWTKMFDELAAGEPMSFNCSAGKDRAGMTAALILTALDVPREVIVNDYALTEKVADFGARDRMRNAKKDENEAAPHSGIAAMPIEASQVFMSSKPMFIEAMFAELEKNHGSAMNYIRDELKVDEQELQKIREMYLTTTL